MNPARATAIVAAIVFAALAADHGRRADAASRSPNTSRTGDTICASAIAQTHAHGSVATVAAWGGSAGTRLLAIDHGALSRLDALTPPAADAATLHKLLAGAKATVDEPRVRLPPPRPETPRAFAPTPPPSPSSPDAPRGAAAYGFHVCQRWGS